jgi:alpha-tubulin suppressor-like RCC1 family protein
MKHLALACALFAACIGCTDFDSFVIGPDEAGAPGVDGSTPDEAAIPVLDAGGDGGAQAECTLDAECDDARVCNGLERCSDGMCAPGTPLTSNEACTTDDGVAGMCAIGLCVPAGCGDGAQLGTEECDDSGESQTCNIDCTEAECGDGKHNASADEDCDDGDDVTNDGCEADCSDSCESNADCTDENACDGEEKCNADHFCVEGTPVTTGECAAAVCPNGVREAGEVCDGSDLNGASCANIDFAIAGPFAGGTLACSSHCQSYDTSACIEGASNPPGTPCRKDEHCLWGCFEQSCEGVEYVGAGEAHNCALFDSGRVACWGSQSAGRLGNGETEVAAVPRLQLVRHKTGDPLVEVAQLSVGARHTLAVTDSGHVYAWGSNEFGQLGRTDRSDTPFATSMFGIDGAPEGVVEVAAGEEHSCFLSSSVFCAGRNDAGQLGDNTTVPFSEEPQQVLGTSGAGALTAVSSLRAGNRHTCAKTATGLACWGGGSAFGDIPIAVSIADVDRVLLESSAQDATCALLTDTSVACFGLNEAQVDIPGKLGVGSTASNVAAPTLVRSGGSTLSGLRSAGLGTAAHCYLDSDNDVWCAGVNTLGQLGANATSSIEAIRLETAAGDNPFETLALDGITSGSEHLCIWNEHHIYCWGDNPGGVLGNEGPNRSVPVEVLGPVAP